MKKILAGMLTAALVLTAGTVGVFAAESQARGTYVDADGDGVCDNYGKYGCGARKGTGRGVNFVDADGDGICDNYASGVRGCRGAGRGCRR